MTTPSRPEPNWVDTASQQSPLSLPPGWCFPNFSEHLGCACRQTLHRARLLTPGLRALSLGSRPPARRRDVMAKDRLFLPGQRSVEAPSHCLHGLGEEGQLGRALPELEGPRLSRHTHAVPTHPLSVHTHTLSAHTLSPRARCPPTHAVNHEHTLSPRA